MCVLKLYKEQEKHFPGRLGRPHPSSIFQQGKQRALYLTCCCSASQPRRSGQFHAPWYFSWHPLETSTAPQRAHACLRRQSEKTQRSPAASRLKSTQRRFFTQIARSFLHSFVSV